MKDNIIKHFTKNGITIVWQPSKCVHSRLCVHGLPAVFNPQKRPWIQLDDSINDDVCAQVRKCPSRALSIEGECVDAEVTVKQGGPLVVSGSLRLKLANGETTEKTGMTELCRCGASGDKPYCDGSHSCVQFDQ